MGVDGKPPDMPTLPQILLQNHMVDRRRRLQGNGVGISGALGLGQPRQRIAEHGLHLLPEFHKPGGVRFREKPPPVRGQVDQQVGPPAHRIVVQTHQLVQAFQGVGVPVTVKPVFQPDAAVAFHRQKGVLLQKFPGIGLDGKVQHPNHIIVGHLRQTGFVAHPAGIRIPQVEQQDLRLEPPDLRDDPPGVVPVALASAAVEPQVVDFSVVAQKLPDLIEKILVIVPGVPAFGAELRRGIVQPHLQPIGPAGVHEFPNHIALAALPGGVGHGIVRVCGGPVGEAVVVLADQDGVGRPGRFCCADPLPAVQGLRTESGKRHGLPIPVHMALIKGADAEVEKGAQLPIQKFQLLFLNRFHRILPAYEFFSFRDYSTISERSAQFCKRICAEQPNSGK